MAILKPTRGEVWWVDFDPIRGSEIAKIRPAIVISNNLSNKFTERLQVVPLTSQTDHLYPCECVVIVQKRPSKAAADQIRTVSIKRLGKRIGVLSLNDLQAVENVIRLQLGL